MANWATSSYTITGSKETLDKIYKAISDNKPENSYDGLWEGKVLEALGIKYEEYGVDRNNLSHREGYYMRGFINDTWRDDNGTIHFDAEEAWGLTDFHTVLEDNLPDIKIYWRTEEPGMEIYCTNDKKGIFFPDRYYVDTCINGKYNIQYFIAEDSMYSWLNEISEGLIASEKDVNKFNEVCADDDYCYVYKFDVI